MLPKSIRWQLPLSYALIALLAALSLGAVLLTTVRGYYAQQEYQSLQANAEAVQSAVSSMYQQKLTPDQIQSQLQSLAFLAQARIRVTNLDGTIRLDSGDSTIPRVIALTYNRGRPVPDIVYRFNDYDVFSSGSSKAAPVGSGGGSIDILPGLFTTATANAVTGTMDFNQRIMMPVAGTPFGFGLNQEFTSDRRSDQSIQLPLLDTNASQIGNVELLDGPAYGTEITDGVGRALIGAAFVAVVLAVGVGWFISRHISDPVLKLTAATRQMADGDLSVRVKLPHQDEFGLLATSFNHMANQVENMVTTLRRFVADAAHELHTPITALHANLELAATDDDPAQRLVFIQRAQEQLQRLEVMTSGLLDLSQIEAGEIHDERAPVEMTALVSGVSELYASRAEQAGLRFQFDTPSEPITGQVNEAQLRRVVGNLLDNAIKFTPENGIIRIGLRREGKSIQLWVQDSGIGIPAEDLPYLFSRFRRARNAASYPGSGLGLAIIKAVIEGHGGQVHVESSVQGTCFSLQLPAAI